MQQLSLTQAADYLEAATIEQSHDAGHAIIHIGNGKRVNSTVMAYQWHSATQHRITAAFSRIEPARAAALPIL